MRRHSLWTDPYVFISFCILVVYDEYASIRCQRQNSFLMPKFIAKLAIFLPKTNIFCHFSGELDEHTITMMSMPRCGVKDKVGMDMSKNHTENPNHRHPRRSKRYALQGRNILLIFHRVAFCQFIFRWIYYCHSSKSAAPERKLAKRSSVHVQCFLFF